MDIQEIREELNNIFTDIVVVITQIADLSDKNVNEIKHSSEFIDKNIKEFLDTISKNVKDIRNILYKKFTEIDIDSLKKDIEDSVVSFVNIISDLELLSLNTICQTRNLGDKRTIISFISAEIKRISDKANKQLNLLKENFNNVYEYISDIADFYDKLKESDVRDSDVDISKIEDIQIRSDVSKLLEYSQFHDIFRQQLEKIESAYLEIDWNDNSLYQCGKKIKFYELAIPLLQDIKEQISDVMNEITQTLKDYLYDLNTDIQNMFSKVGIISHSHNSIETSRKEIFNYLNILIDKTEILREHIRNTHKNIEGLLKFKKDFYNLKIVTHIEIGRIGLSYLMNLVDSMTNTYNVLLSLIEKLLNIIKIWENFSKELYSTIQECHNLVTKYRESDTKDSFDKIIVMNNKIDNELSYIKELLLEKDYLQRLKDDRIRILTNLNKTISEFEKEHMSLKSSLENKDIESEEFIKGYESLEIETIRADEDNISTIELF